MLDSTSPSEFSKEVSLAECLLYATYWFQPILSGLPHTAQKSAELNKNRAPSGPESPRN